MKRVVKPNTAKSARTRVLNEMIVMAQALHAHDLIDQRDMTKLERISRTPLHPGSILREDVPPALA